MFTFPFFNLKLTFVFNNAFLTKHVHFDQNTKSRISKVVSISLYSAILKKENLKIGLHMWWLKSVKIYFIF